MWYPEARRLSILWRGELCLCHILEGRTPDLISGPKWQLSVCLLLDVCLCVSRACQCSNGRILSFTAAAAFRNYNCGIWECWGNRTAIIKLSSSSLSENDQDVEIKGKYLTQFQLHTWQRWSCVALNYVAYIGMQYIASFLLMINISGIMRNRD